MDDVYAVVQLLLTVNVPFGAAVVLIFFWRRLSASAVWAAVLVCAVLNIMIPAWLPSIVPSIGQSPALTREVTQADGRTSAVFFDSVIRSDPNDPASPRLGQGRFHLELVTLDRIGIDVAGLSPSGRNAARFFYDGSLPFVILILVSYFTKRPPLERTDQFFGKMKTPVGADPELEAAAMAETRTHPHRFDQTKLFPGSSWEFTRWNLVDAVGFTACLALSFSILGLFWFFLRLAAS